MSVHLDVVDTTQTSLHFSVYRERTEASLRASPLHMPSPFLESPDNF